MSLGSKKLISNSVSIKNKSKGDVHDAGFLYESAG